MQVNAAVACLTTCVSVCAHRGVSTCLNPSMAPVAVHGLCSTFVFARQPVLCRYPADFASRVLRSSSASHASAGYCKESRCEFLLCQLSLSKPGRAAARASQGIWQGQSKRATAPSADQRRARGFTLYSLNTRAHVARCGLHTLTGRVSEVSRSGPATSNILCCLPHIAHCTRRLPATHAAPTTHALA